MNNTTATYRKKQKTFLEIFNTWTWRLLLVAAAVQLIFFFSWENLFGVVICVAGWRLTQICIFRRATFERFTMSVTVILGYSLTQYFLPTVFTLVEQKPLIYNLDLPYLVFVHSILALGVILLAHFAYRRNQVSNNVFRNKIQNLLGKLNFFRPPTNLNIWIMGFFGLGSMTYVAFNGGLIATFEERSGLIKLLTGFVPFAYAPLFLLLKEMYEPKAEKKRSTGYIMGYLLLLVAVGIGGNSRGLFMTGITSAGIAWLLGLLLGKMSHRIFNVKTMLISLVGFWVVTGPLTDLGTAMVVVRSQRGDVSSGELLARTLETFQDKESLAIFKTTVIDVADDSGWDERYFDNIFLSRFSNLKYNDMGLVQSEKIGKVDPEMTKHSVDHIWAILPQPALRVLGVDVSKEDVVNGSFGDYLYARAGGSSVGSYRLGQFASTGMSAFGWWYLVLLGIGLVPLFYMLDLLVVQFRVIGSRERVVYVSMAGLLSLTSIFMYLSLGTTSESVVNTFTYLIRGWLQLVILYLLVLLGARQISRLITRGK